MDGPPSLNPSLFPIFYRRQVDGAVVGIVSDAELGGVLADFARTGGTAVANVIMADFAKRAAAEFAQDEMPTADPSSIEGPSSPSSEPSAPSPQQPASLSPSSPSAP